MKVRVTLEVEVPDVDDRGSVDLIVENELALLGTMCRLYDHNDDVWEEYKLKWEEVK